MRDTSLRIASCLPQRNLPSWEGEGRGLLFREYILEGLLGGILNGLCSCNGLCNTDKVYLAALKFGNTYGIYLTALEVYGILRSMKIRISEDVEVSQNKIARLFGIFDRYRCQNGNNVAAGFDAMVWDNPKGFIGKLGFDVAWVILFGDWPGNFQRTQAKVHMKSSSKEIVRWVEKTRHWFSYAVMDMALGIDTAKRKTLRRVVIKRLCDQGQLRRHLERKGVFIKSPKVIDWQKKCSRN